MSYDRLSSLEAGRSGGYSDDPEFQQLQYELKNKLQTLLSNNRKLSNDVSILGTKKDTKRVQDRVEKTRAKSLETCKEMGEGIKKLQTWQDLTKQQKYEQAKISSDFQAALQDFQGLQRRVLEKERLSLSTTRAGQDTEGQESAGAGGQQEQLQQQQQQEFTQLAEQGEVDFQESLIIEREEEIRNIEQGVTDLNVLFRNVAHIVSEQGEQLVTIQDSVENVRDDTRQADIENRQAARYQKAARNKSFCLLLILGIILTIIILAIVLG